jgi:hypothetical protein
MDAWMKIAARIVSLCALLMVVACATLQKLPPRVTLGGFSLARPTGDEWMVKSQTADQVIYGKPGYTGETIVLQATLIRPPNFKPGTELLRYAETVLRKDLDPVHFRILRLEVNPQDIQGESCALARLEAAERAVTGNSPVNSMLDVLTLTCVHPKDRSRGISVVYSHRHYPEDRDAQFDQAGAALLGTLKFEPL